MRPADRSPRARAREDVPRHRIALDRRPYPDLRGCLVGHRVEVELAVRKSRARSASGRGWWLPSKCDSSASIPSKRSCVEPIEVRRYGLPTLVRPSRSEWSVGLNWTESPSGSNPDGLPAGVRPTRWNVPVMTRNGTAPRQHAERLPRPALDPRDLITAPRPARRRVVCLRSARHVIQAVRVLGGDGRIPRPLGWLVVIGLLPIAGPLNEIVLLLVGVTLAVFYRDLMHEAWSSTTEDKVRPAASVDR
jgi:hypothetical protein